MVEKAIADSPEKREGPWLKEAARQRLERDGYIKETPRNTIRELAMAAANIAGEEAVIVALATVKADASSRRSSTEG